MDRLLLTAKGHSRSEARRCSLTAVAWTGVAFTKEQADRVIAAISQRAPQIGSCSICRKSKWTLANGLVSLTLLEPNPRRSAPAWSFPPDMSVGGSTGVSGVTEALLAYGLVCGFCGHIELISAAAIGNPHLVAVVMPPPPYP